MNFENTNLNEYKRIPDSQRSIKFARCSSITTIDSIEESPVTCKRSREGFVNSVSGV